jgi:alkylation response protein AidB-like acyl-CoA dehydrogenase
MDFSWTKEQEMWRASVRDFSQSVIRPIVRQMDQEGKIPEAVVKGMADNIMRLIIAREILGNDFLPYRWGAQEL